MWERLVMLHWSQELDLLCLQEVVVRSGGTLCVGHGYPHPYSAQSHLTSFTSCHDVYQWLKMPPFGRHLLSLCFMSSAFSPAIDSAVMKGCSAELSSRLFRRMVHRLPVHMTLHLLVNGKCSTALIAGTSHGAVVLQLPKEFSYPARPSCC